MGKDIWGHPEHKRTGENLITAPRYNSRVKTEPARILQNPLTKDARAHKDDLYFLNQVFKAYGVK